MDSITILIMLFLSIVFGAVCYILGFLHGNSLRRPEADKPTPPQAPLPQKLEERKEAGPKIELGAVNRPSAEALEEKRNPKIKEEEEAWEDIVGTIDKESIQAIANHPNSSLNLI